MRLAKKKLVGTLFFLWNHHFAVAFSVSGNDHGNNKHHNNNSNKDVLAFSLSAHQQARAKETSESMDCSRFHFQILIVDSNNFHGRIVEGILARVAEYNDAMCILFPESATIVSSSSSSSFSATRNIVDATAPDVAVSICESLGLCSTKSSAVGTRFDVSMLDSYDMIVAMDDSVRSRILSMLPNDKRSSDYDYYASKCRLLSEFLSGHFSNSIGRRSVNNDDNDLRLQLYNMLDYDLLDRVIPFSDSVIGRSSSVFETAPPSSQSEVLLEPRIVLTKNGAAVPNKRGWRLVEAAMIVASAGIVRFCLDTMTVQLERAFQSLLERHFHRPEHLTLDWEKADDQLRKSSFSVTGYFSPKQRKERFEQHMISLRKQLGNPEI